MRDSAAGLRRWLALAASAVVAVLAGGAAVLLASDNGTPVERLPDLVQRAPYQLTGDNAGTARRPRFRLGFASAVENLGDGPLRVVGRRDARGATMTADQLVERSDGSTVRVRGIGRLRYTRSTSHQHWHYLGFDRYSVLSLGRARPLRRDRKSGFCLGDRYDARPGERLAGDPGRAVRTGECGKNQPRLRSVAEGISVGYGDDYAALLEGQYVDITGLPAGRYELVHWANADRRLRETDYDNNAASIVIDLRWPRGLRRPPSIDVVRRCGDGRRCRPPQ